jgi:hypothetical protein
LDYGESALNYRRCPDPPRSVVSVRACAVFEGAAPHALTISATMLARADRADEVIE